MPVPVGRLLALYLWLHRARIRARIVQTLPPGKSGMLYALWPQGLVFAAFIVLMSSCGLGVGVLGFLALLSMEFRLDDAKKSHGEIFDQMETEAMDVFMGRRAAAEKSHLDKILDKAPSSPERHRL
jgi:hypothetical protein